MRLAKASIALLVFQFTHMPRLRRSAARIIANLDAFAAPSSAHNSRLPRSEFALVRLLARR